MGLFNSNRKDIFWRAIGNPLSKGLQRLRLPTHERLTSTMTATVTELDKMGLKSLLQSKIGSLVALEESWGHFEGLYSQLIKIYSKGSFMVGEETISEFSAAKDGWKPLDNDQKKVIINYKNKKIESVLEYPADKMIPYINLWINDRDRFVSDYPVSLYGYQKAVSEWQPKYNNFFKDILEKAKYYAPKEERKHLANFKRALDQVLDMIMGHINAREEIYYTARSPFSNAINEAKNIFSTMMTDCKLPHHLADIAFQRTFYYINPSMVFNQGWYYNPYWFFIKLVELNGELDNPIKQIEQEAEGIDRDGGVDLKKNGKYGKFAYMQDGKSSGNLAQEADRILPVMRKWLEDIRDRMQRNGKFFPYVMKEDIKGWTREEENLIEEGIIIPGLDINGWPLEVTIPGQEYMFLGKSTSEWGFPPNPDYAYVLVDIFDWALGLRPHNEVRKVLNRKSKELSVVTGMDPLLQATLIDNEYDAVRDDIRDGRYHKESLTVIDYIMARKRFGPEKWRAPIAAQEWEPIGEEQLDNAVVAGSYRKNVKMKTLRGETVGRDAREPSNLLPAFDKGDLKYQGEKMKHLGRRYYHQSPETIWEAASIIKEMTDSDLKNRFYRYIGPCITTRGLSMYIIERIVNSTKFFADARKELISFAKGAWYDFGPRAFGKDGPQDPFDLRKTVQEAMAQVEEVAKQAEQAGQEFVEKESD